MADDGQGLDPRTLDAGRRSLGLASMRERAESLGGRFRIESHPGGGTRVVVTVPLASIPDKEQADALARAAG